MTVLRLLLLAGLTASFAPAADDAAFHAAVDPLFKNVCAGCHNPQLSSGGMNIQVFLDPQSLTKNRDGWEIILQRLRAGEMPPQGIPKPPAEKLDALTSYIQARLDEIDKRRLSPTPARSSPIASTVTNTATPSAIFSPSISRPIKTSPPMIPATASITSAPFSPSRPAHVEVHEAAQRIATRAMGLDPLPKPIEIERSGRNKAITRLDRSTVETTFRVDFDGDYNVRFGLQGERPADAKPVTLAFWIDGKFVQSMSVETKPSKLVYFDPYSEEHMRVHLTEGEHTFRSGFLDDDFVGTVAQADLYNRKKNKFVDSLTFVGPYASEGESASRKKILICDPKSGAACVQRIVANLANHAYRRPATPQEIAAAHALRRSRARPRPKCGAGNSVGSAGHAGLAQFPFQD